MSFHRTLIGCFVLALVGFLGPTCAQADPLLFSHVVALQNGNTRVDLFSNPGITLTGPEVSFLVDITGTLAAGETHTLLVTYTEFGGSPLTQMFLIPAFGTVPPPFTQLFTFTSSNATFSGIMATLTIDILGVSPDFEIPGGPRAGERVDSYTFNFRVAQPVPEPGTVFLLGTGLIGWALRVKRFQRRAD